MTITIDVSPEAAGRLREQADRSGLALPEYVSRPVEDRAAPDTLLFLTPEGEAVAVLDAPINAREVAVVSEKTLAKIWDTPEEEAGCQALLAGM